MLNLLQIKLPEWTEDTEYQPNDIANGRSIQKICLDYGLYLYVFVGSRDDTQQFPNISTELRVSYSHPMLGGYNHVVEQVK